MGRNFNFGGTRQTCQTRAYGGLGVIWILHTRPLILLARTVSKKGNMYPYIRNIGMTTFGKLAGFR